MWARGPGLGGEELQDRWYLAPLSNPLTCPSPVGAALPHKTHRGFHFSGQNQLFLFLQKAKEKGKLATGKPSKSQGLESHKG